MVVLNKEVEQALVSYLDAKGLDEKSKKKYMEFYKKLANVHGELTQRSIDEFLRYNPHPPAISMIKHLITAIKRWDFPQEIKVKTLDLDIPKVRVRKKIDTKFLIYEDLEKLINGIKGDDILTERTRCAILVQWWGALREEELLGIKLQDLEVDKFDPTKSFQKIKIRSESAKFGSGRYAYIPTDVYKRVIAYLKKRASENLNFADRLNKGVINIWWMGKSRYSYLLAKYTKEVLGIAYNTHALRHGRGTDLVKKDVPIEKVRKIMGHKSISSTQVYIHLADKDIEDALK